MKLLFIGVFLFLGSLAEAATIEAIGGNTSVSVSRSGKELRLAQGATLEKEDVIHTNDAVIDVRYPDRSLVRVARNSSYKVEAKDSSTQKLIAELLLGAVRILVPERQDKSKVRLELQTPNGVVGVRGTEFFVEHSKQTDLFMIHGEVSFANRSDSKNSKKIAAGYKSSVSGKMAPQSPQAYSVSDLLKRLDSKSDLFGPLAERKHGAALPVFAKSDVTSKPENIAAAKPNILLPPAGDQKAVAVAAQNGEALAQNQDTKAEDAPKSKAESDAAKELNLLFLKAALDHNLEDAKKYLEQGADASAKDEDDNTAMHMAVQGESSEDQSLMVLFLATHEVPLDDVNSDKDTALHILLNKTKDGLTAAEAVKALVDNGASATIKNGKKETALQIIKRRKLKIIEKVLLGKK